MGEHLADNPIGYKRPNRLLPLLMRKTGLQGSELLLLTLVLFVIWFAAISAISLIKSSYDQRIENQLTTLLESADQSLHVWSHDRKAIVENLASDEDLLAAT
ncbi:MAG: hypothetical protein COW18_02965 [Zetaproteobacteria bacterium CG12_big_fil_rev_8_21_14_0_65_54_13]|nr:MAG: hypothetical protein COX55_07695 [Zetaproteobacteria bacterium CG23_combo_of_CG06-09_8_20_14_all_54_7]PIW50798.1 MAG: hypothetical protein COW18_02965 [Zetaproteobacteria bacterium CG12_big_fil_rev_8_21_14_0_65_54_13]PIX55295.1 MAG: hypothetical protein COZ50_03535 [Zetaproteobacteria bacterium CG_4_10_14_3_um_filter_54_28]PJA26869.1 MAG: hypothetical protein CO188_13645 [Zetaproteobacteria bacterium CG_4_9_14_3_um_filter_54_145]